MLVVFFFIIILLLPVLALLFLLSADVDVVVSVFLPFNVAPLANSMQGVFY